MCKWPGFRYYEEAWETAYAVSETMMLEALWELPVRKDEERNV